MAYKFQYGAAQLSGSVTVESDLTAQDDITTTAGSVLVGAAQTFKIGNSALTQAALKPLLNVTGGTALADKVLVADSARDISGLNDISAAGITLSDLTADRVALTTTSGQLNTDNAIIVTTTRDESPFYVPSEGMYGWVGIQVTSSASGSTLVGDGLLWVGDSNGDDVLVVNPAGGMTLSNNGNETFSAGTGDVNLTVDSSGIYYGTNADVGLVHQPNLGIRLTNSGSNPQSRLELRDEHSYITSDSANVLTLYGRDNIHLEISGASGASTVVNADATSVTVTGDLKATGTITGSFSGNGSNIYGISADLLDVESPDAGTQVQPLLIVSSGSVGASDVQPRGREGVGYVNDGNYMVANKWSGSFEGQGGSLYNVPTSIADPDGGDWVQPLMIATSGNVDQGSASTLRGTEGIGWNEARQHVIAPSFSGSFEGQGGSLYNVRTEIASPDGGNWVQPLMIATSGNVDQGSASTLRGTEGIGWNEAAQHLIAPNFSGSFTGNGSGIYGVSSDTIDVSEASAGGDIQPFVFVASGSLPRSSVQPHVNAHMGYNVNEDKAYFSNLYADDFEVEGRSILGGDVAGDTTHIQSVAALSGNVIYNSLTYSTDEDTELDGATATYVICSGAVNQNVTLPASPAKGQWYSVKKCHSSNPSLTLTIHSASSGGGKQIEGEDSIVLETVGAAVTLVYSDTTATWMVF